MSRWLIALVAVGVALNVGAAAFWGGYAAGKSSTRSELDDRVRAAVTRERLRGDDRVAAERKRISDGMEESLRADREVALMLSVVNDCVTERLEQRAVAFAAGEIGPPTALEAKQFCQREWDEGRLRPDV